MAVRVSFSRDGGILVVSEGDVKGSDIKEFNDMIYSSTEKIKSISYQLCDFRSTATLDVTQDDVRQIAAGDQRAFAVNPGMRIAIVVSTDLGYGLCRMWEMLARQSQLETMVFRDMKKAKKWIRAGLKVKSKKN